ncbi:MAG: DUF3422 domain-containing protein [Halofilum sp. (in: g-proteobacteria)]|nr:DUF3422 domain-containing protein [Halofilum sp. (in: g-proteobacteria)]
MQQTRSTLPGLRDHAQRRALNDELNARPAQPLAAPVRLTHLVMLCGEGTAARDRAHVAALCRKARVAPPADGDVYHSVDLGEVRLRWERHAECSTYTFYRDGVPARPFADPAIEAMPGDWVNRIPGERLVAMHVALVDAAVPGADDARPAPDFSPARLNGSRIADGAACAWTDFRIRGDGYSRILVRSHGIGEREAGHQVRRLLEIESYRMLAMVALPLIREVGPRLSELERELGAVTAGMREPGGVSEADEQRHLARLTGLAAEIEHIAARANYRIAATRAYHALVARRLSLLREGRLQDLEPLGDYLERRLQPAADTCEAVRRRIDDVAERVGRANALLRTRLDVKQATQSRDLLDSMNRRAGLQLRVEQAVEAITVIAGAYYSTGLLRQLGAGLADAVPALAGLPVDTVVGLATPALVLALWLGVRHLRARTREEPA